MADIQQNYATTEGTPRTIIPEQIYQDEPGRDFIPQSEREDSLAVYHFVLNGKWPDSKRQSLRR